MTKKPFKTWKKTIIVYKDTTITLVDPN